MSLPGRPKGEYRSAQHEGTPANTTLADQQAVFKHAVVRVAHDDAGDAAAGLLRADPGREPLLHIYRQAYTARLASALRDNFGVLPQVLGDEAFDALALAYIAAHPSRRPSIRWFGDTMPAFMAARDDLVPHPAMTDIARMEWGLRTAFDAADANALDANALAAVPPEAWPSLVFEWLPSVQLLDLDWNIEPVWRALKDADPADSPGLPEPEAKPHTLMIWRPALETLWRSLDAPAARLLRAAIAGCTFGALCEIAVADVGEEQAALHAASALRSWLDDGLLSAWRVAAADSA